MSQEVDEAPEPLGIDHFAADAYRLDANAFKARHGDAFLVRKGPLAASRRPHRPQRTMVIKGVSERDTSPPMGPSASGELIVVPIRHTGRSPYPSMITVGRTRNNDVVLPDVVVSKFHAFFKEEDGKLLLSDADSRNGTRVDDRPVAKQKAGKGTVVGPGMQIRFGLLDFWLLDAAALWDLVRRSCPAP
jgi:hypothetical protein